MPPAVPSGPGRPDIQRDLERLWDVLTNGGVIIFPCDVGYGMATASEDGLRRINAAKKRGNHKREGLLTGNAMHSAWHDRATFRLPLPAPRAGKGDVLLGSVEGAAGRRSLGGRSPSGNSHRGFDTGLWAALVPGQASWLAARAPLGSCGTAPKHHPSRVSCVRTSCSPSLNRLADILRPARSRPARALARTAFCAASCWRSH